MPGFLADEKSYAVSMKILLADPHPDVRSALQLALSRLPGIAMLGVTGDVFHLLAQAAGECPDLILIDPELVRGAGFRGAARQPLTDLLITIRRICPHAKIVALSSRFEAEAETLACGADGFASKAEPPDRLLALLARFSQAGPDPDGVET